MAALIMDSTTRKVWKVVRKEDLPPNGNILWGRFVLSIKDPETDDEIWKARFVAQGYIDKEKQYLVHDTVTSRQYSSRILIGLASTHGFKLFSTDVTQAYLQSDGELLRDIFIKPPNKFGLEPEQYLNLLKPLYGLSDAGDYWGKTLTEHLKNGLRLECTTSDPAFHFKTADDKIMGLCTTYVDDLLEAGDKAFQELASETQKVFKCKQTTYDNFQFAGL